MTLRLAGLSCLVLLVALSADRGQAATADDEAESPVRTVLRQEAYPWYDSQTDQINPLVTEQPTWATWLGDRLKAFFDWLGKLWGKLRDLARRLGASHVVAAESRLPSGRSSV